MPYGANRNVVATDAFPTAIDAFWDNGYADWNTAAFVAGGHIDPAAINSNVGMRRNAGVYTADQFSRVTSQSTAASKEIGAACRMHPTSSTDEACYIGAVSDFGTDQYFIYECSAGAGSVGFATLTSGAWGSAPTEVGDIVTLEAEGTTLRMGTVEGGADTQRLTTTDATLAGSTYTTVGLYQFTDTAVANARITAWEGGSIGAIGTRVVLPFAHPGLGPAMASRFPEFKQGISTAAAVVNDMVAAGTIVIAGAADLDATGSLLAAGTVVINGAAILNAAGNLLAAGSVVINGATILNAAGNLVAAGSVVINGAAVLNATGNVVAVGSIVINGLADLTSPGSSDITAAGALVITGAALLTAIGSLTAAGTLWILGTPGGADLVDANAPPSAGGDEWLIRFRRRLRR